MIPYQEGQIVRFRGSDGGETVSSVSWAQYFANVAACAGCEATKKENLKCTFTFGAARYIEFSIDQRPIIFLQVYALGTPSTIGGNLDFHTRDGVSEPLCNGQYQVCKSSVTLNGRTYLDVLEISNGSSGTNAIIKAWYKLPKGFIGYEWGSGVVYTQVD